MKPRDIFLPEYDKYNAEVRTKLILRKFVYYVIFLIVSTIAVFFILPNPQTNYNLIKLFENLFLTNKANKLQLEDVTTISEFWTFVEDSIVNNLNFDSNCANISDTDNIYRGIVILGTIRLRQLKVRGIPCDVPAYIETNCTMCYGGYLYYNKDTENIVTTSTDCGALPATAWSYNYPRMIFDDSYEGKVSTYDSGGFHVELNRSKEMNLEAIKCLKVSKWIQINTRAVFVDFTIFHCNINMFIIAKLLFEFPPTGDILTSWQFYPVKLFHYDTWVSCVCLALEIIFVLYIIYFTIEELLEFCYYKCEYCKKFWNIIDLTIVILGYCVIVMKIFIYLYAHTQFKNAYNKEYPLHLYLGHIYMVFSNLVAILLFLIWIKLLKFFVLSSSYQALQITIAKCKHMIFSFIIIFLIVLVAFALAGYLLFGYHSVKFRTIKFSLLTLFLALIGDFDYDEIVEGRITATIFVILFIFIVFFILFSLFLAIVIHTYSEVKNDIYFSSTDTQISDIVKRGRCFRRRTNYMYVPGNQIIGNLRKILKLCKFSDAQVDVLYHQYGIDECRAINENDIRMFMAKIKTNIYQDVHARSKRTSISADQFMCQRKKVDIIDKNIKILLSRLVSLDKRCGRKKKRKCCSRKNKKTYGDSKQRIENGRKQSDTGHTDKCRCRNKCETPKIRVCPKKTKLPPDVDFCMEC